MFNIHLLTGGIHLQILKILTKKQVTGYKKSGQCKAPTFDKLFENKNKVTTLIAGIFNIAVHWGYRTAT